MKILLLSAYDAASHRRWHLGLRRMFAADDWTVLTLPARYFSWRVRGNSLSWAFAERELLERDYDLLLVTSMVDLSALRGFVPALARIPTLVYFHENQFDYPASAQQFSSIEPQLLNVYTALAADWLLFNSEYNRRSFLDGANAMLGKFPDCVPAGLVEQLENSSEVLPVPLEPGCYRPRAPGSTGELQLVWNHRWEYDKGPDRLLALLRLVEAAQLVVTVHVVGQQFRSAPEAFREIRELLGSSQYLRPGRWGFIESEEDYRQLLATADVVLSTAIHDFQGLSVLEAVAAGCLPLVPDRLCYGEWFPSSFLYPSRLDDAASEAEGVLQRVQRLCEAKLAKALPPAPDVSRFSQLQLCEAYRAIFAKTAIGQPTTE